MTISIRSAPRVSTSDRLRLRFVAPSQKSEKKEKDFRGDAFASRERIEKGGAVLWWGTGAPEDEGTAHQRGAVAALRAAARLGLARIVIEVPSPRAVEPIIRGLRLAEATLDRKGKRKKPEKVFVDLVRAKPTDIARAEALALGCVLAREIADLPPDEKAPAAVARMAAARLRAARVRTRVLDVAALRRGGYGGILAVGKGSDRPPVLFRAEWNPPRSHGAAIVLVGKGVVFDSGGLSIKTYEGMKTMKCDCAGGGAVLGAVLAAARLRLPVRVVALVGFVENMLGGSAMKPGDVIRTRSGKTIEMLNTDAEGRIVLADLLADACDEATRIRAAGTIDVATLTGACVVALGEDRAGLFANDKVWSRRVREAAARAGEWVWPLPLGPEFDDEMKSKIADRKNVGTRWGGACNAAAFLTTWAPSVWAHLDIAGPGFSERESGGRIAGGSGFGVATLVEVIRDLAGR